MDLETTNFLLSDAGRDLLDAARNLSGSLLQRLTHLRKAYSPEVASAALELLELRDRAAKKFSKADEMFFTREALEQSSGEVVSRYRAQRFPEDGRVLDLACGIGGDTIGLAEKCYVTAVDRDPVRIAMAKRNLGIYGLSDRVEFVCSDVEDIDLDADAAFLDPSRRSGGRRVRSLQDVSPSIDFITKLAARIPNTAVKLSPATDDDELASLGGEVEFLSYEGECKEALVWLGGFKTTKRRATIVSSQDSLVDEGVGDVAVTDPKRYLHEPDPAVIRAHLVGEVAVRLRASKLDDQIAYLTSDELVQTPFARAYSVMEATPFNIKTLNRRLREINVGHVIIKKRGVPFEPEEVMKRLKLSGTAEVILVLTKVRGKTWVMLVEALANGKCKK